MLKKNTRKILVVMVLAFCCIIPVHAVEMTDIVQSVSGGDADNTISSGDSITQDSVDISDLLKDYTLVLPSDTKEKDYETYCYQLKAQLCEHQMDYLSSLYVEKNNKYNIEKSKFDLGYITGGEVEEANMQVKAVELQKKNAEAQLNFYLECIQLRGKKYEGDLLSEELPQLTKDYLTIFMKQSSQLNSYNQQIEIHELYLSNENLREEDKQALGIQLANLQVNRRNYEIDLVEYVKQLQLQYEVLLRQIQQYDNEIAVMQLKIQKQKLLYESGKVAKITLTEMETELQRLKYERLSNLCDAQMVLYLLEHTIENQTVLVMNGVEC